jgi:hypothetical protein
MSQVLSIVNKKNPLKNSRRCFKIVEVLFFEDSTSNELPRSKLRGIGGIGTIIMPPHPALSREGRGNMVTTKRSYEESIDSRSAGAFCHWNLSLLYLFLSVFLPIIISIQGTPIKGFKFTWSSNPFEGLPALHDTHKGDEARYKEYPEKCLV